MTKTILDNSKSLYCSLCKIGCRFNCRSVFEEVDYEEICEWLKHTRTNNCPKTVKEIVDSLTYLNGETMTMNEEW